MSALPWFRMYHEFATDPKVQMLSEADQRRFVMLLCMRCSNGNVTLQDSEVTFQLRISAEEWAATKAVFLDKGLIDFDNKPTKWEQRQKRSDTSNERVFRHRQKLKRSSDDGCNVTVTSQRKRKNKKEPPTPLREKRNGAGADAPAVGRQQALEAFEAYNAAALRLGLPQAAMLTPDRERKLIARLKLAGMTGWQIALANLERSDFLRGRTSQGFRANLDWMLQAESFNKLHDGFYTKPAGSNGSAQINLRALL